MSANVETMFSRETPWHGLGVRVDHALDSEQALIAAGLDWSVALENAYTQDMVAIPDTKLVVRSSDRTVLGVVGNRYTPVQNRDAFNFTDSLLGAGVLYETAGSLAGGKKIWMLARLEKSDFILDEEIIPYVCFTNSHNGSSGVTVVTTPVQVVCQNTLSLALSTAKRSWSVRHTKAIHGRMDEARETLNLTNVYMRRLKAEAEELVKKEVSRAKWENIVKQLFPITEDTGLRGITTRTQQQEGLLAAMNADYMQNVKYTGWGAVQAVTDYETHFKSMRETENSQENAFAALLSRGMPLTQRVLELI